MVHTAERFVWVEESDGHFKAESCCIVMTLVREWDRMRGRHSWEYRYEYTGQERSGGGVAESAGLDAAKAEAEIAATWNASPVVGPETIWERNNGST